jgi:hypothetical protein
LTVLDELKEQYEAGKLDVIRHDLEYFITSNRPKLLAFIAEKEQELHFCELEPNLKLELAVRLAILDSRILNPLSDAKEQLAEIKRYIWIEGVRLCRPPNTEECARRWIENYSRGWREFRLLAALYVFEREKEFFLGLLDDYARNSG